MRRRHSGHVQPGTSTAFSLNTLHTGLGGPAKTRDVETFDESLGF